MTDITSTFGTGKPEKPGKLSIRQILEEHLRTAPNYARIEKALESHDHGTELRAAREKMAAQGIFVGQGLGETVRKAYSVSVEELAGCMDGTPGSMLFEAVAQTQGDSFMMGVKEAIFKGYRGF